MQHLAANAQGARHVSQDAFRCTSRADRQALSSAILPRSRGTRQRKALVTVNSLATETNPAPEKYDYILVGAGSAGSILANKLSADPSKKVLILEAGGSNDSVNVRMPAGITRLFKSELDWNLYTNKQEGVNDRRLYLARGKMVGGSSSSNATLYQRGSKADYDSWKMPGWTAKDALHYFIQCEDNHEGAVPNVHGVGGGVKVENPRYINPMHDAYFEAAKQIGLPYNPDFNDWGHSQEGYGEFQVYHDNGERADMYRQYLKPVQKRDNLTLLTKTRTLKVVLEKRGSRQTARGVQFNSTGPDGIYHTAELTSEGEVIMCAGAIHTPHLLSLSGIGPAQQLRDHDVQVAVDLPGVGQNLQDHPACLTAFQLKPEMGDISQLDEMLGRKGQVRPKAILNYLLRRKGPLTSTGCDHGAFLSTRGDGRVDLQLRMVAAMALDPDGVNAYVAIGKLAEQGKSWPTGYTLQLLAVRPRSKGKVQLRSDDPFDTPLIDARYLTDDEGADLATLREGLKFSRRLAEAEAFSSITDHEEHPGKNVQSDADINEYIRTTLHSGNAVVGTCAMGQDARQGAVVDGELRVHGTDGLRVVDASVIPVIPGAQTGAAAIMVAERAAAILTGKGGPKQDGSAPRREEPALAGV